jgi:hypothetical protein
MQMAPVRFTTFQLEGGLDLITPTMSLKPGVARDALNFEAAVTGGYTTVAGNERYDGRIGNPSDATFSAIKVTDSSSITVGGTIDNGTGTTATVIAIDGLLVYYTKITNSFAVGDTINAGPTVTELGYSLTSKEVAQYNKLAADVYRALIQPVPGGGPIRGVAYLLGNVYAWRDDQAVAPTALRLYKATTSGWVQVLFPYELSFTASGTTPIVDGNAIANGLGITGTVVRVVLETGTWAAGTAAGRLILSASSAAWTAGNNIQVGGVTRATVTPPAGSATYLAGARIVYTPGGRVQTDVSNFGGAQATKLYGCDNVNRGFEFDGTTIIPIRTGMAADAPTNVMVHKNQLWFSFGPSIQASGLATPYAWTVVLGALELVCSDDVTGFLPMPGSQDVGTAAIVTKNSVFMLYGPTSGSYKLVSFNVGLGGAKYTIRNMVDGQMLDDRGVVSVSATQSYGNFDTSTLTFAIRPYIQDRRGTATASGVNRERSQYRVFYSDGTALYITIVNGKLMGAMPVVFPNPVLCWCEGATNERVEVSYFGSDDGYVRRMDVGTSFDGEPIDYRLLLNFHHIGSPRVLKRFRKIALEVTGEGYTECSIGYSLAYNDAKLKDQPSYAVYANAFSEPRWDSFVWDYFDWDGRGLGPVEVEAQGSAENIALGIQGRSDTWASFTINTATIHYSGRRGMR